MCVKTGRDHNQIRSEFGTDVLQRGLKHSLLFISDGVGLDRDIHSSAEPAAVAGFTAGTGSRIPRVLVHREEKDARISVKNSLRSIAMMHIPVDNGDSFD